MLAILISLIASSTAYSNPTDRVRLKKGERAPFSGTLLSDQALARVISELKSQVELAKLEMERQKRLAEANLQAEKKVFEGEKKMLEAKIGYIKAGHEKELKILQAQLARATSRRWYQSPYLNLAIGAIVGGGICAGAAAGVSAAD